MLQGLSAWELNFGVSVYAFPHFGLSAVLRHIFDKWNLS